MSDSETDVLIVGAGPTGLMLALELALCDINIRIIESTPARLPESRALVLHPRSLELLHGHGLLDSIIAKGRFNSTVRMFCNQQQVVEIELRDLPFQDTSYPLPLMISQADTERILEEKLAEYGVKVERPLAAESVVQEEHSVLTSVQRGDWRGTIRSKYVVGCDGAHSVVRKSAKLSFDGAAYTQDFILADLKVDWEMKDCLHVFIGGQGFLVAFPVPMKEGLWRFICSRPLGVNKDAEPTIDDFEEVVGRFVPGTTKLSEPVWISKFALHHRMANKYREGRMFVAGDAAHIHSPAGGQGMNTGIQDAANLGWKIASVLKNFDEDEKGLLDSYNEERYKVGVRLMQGTDRMFELMATTNPVLLWLRNTLFPWIMPFVMKSPQRRANRFRFVSQLGIRYRNSSIVSQAESWTGKIKAGDRAANSKLLSSNGEETTMLDVCIKSPGYHLFLFAGETDSMDLLKLEELGREIGEGTKDGLGVHYITWSKVVNGDGLECYNDPDAKLHSWYGFTDAGYLLVRPDTHVEFIGPVSALSELRSWLKR